MVTTTALSSTLLGLATVGFFGATLGAVRYKVPIAHTSCKFGAVEVDSMH